MRARIHISWYYTFTPIIINSTGFFSSQPGSSFWAFCFTKLTYSDRIPDACLGLIKRGGDQDYILLLAKYRTFCSGQAKQNWEPGLNIDSVLPSDNKRMLAIPTWWFIPTNGLEYSLSSADYLPLMLTKVHAVLHPVFITREWVDQGWRTAYLSNPRYTWNQA